MTLSRSLLAALMAATLSACAAFDNRPPVLRAVNGVPYDEREGLPVDDPAFEVRIGERFEITLDAFDPGGHGLRVWWPYAPPGWNFPYDGLEGHWDVPDVAPIWPFTSLLVLEDLHPRDPGITLANIPLRLMLPGTDDAPVIPAHAPVFTGDTGDPVEADPRMR